MFANFEQRNFYQDNARAWVCRYKNLHNIVHWHLEHELICCQKGSARVMMDNVPHLLTEGMCLFCQGSSVHSVDALEEDCVLVVCIFGAQLAACFTEDKRLENPLFPDRYDVCARLLAMREELAARRPFYGEKVNAIMTQLAVDIFRGEKLAGAAPHVPAALIQYRALLTMISAQAEFISFRDAAAYMNMSEAYFSRFFRHITGMTFTRYINLIKVVRAMELLSVTPGITNAELMLRSGFDTLRNFHRVFKEVTGYTPRRLPKGFLLEALPLPADGDAFDPTLSSSIIA